MDLDLSTARGHACTPSRVSKRVAPGTGSERAVYRALSFDLFFTEHTFAGRRRGAAITGDNVPGAFPGRTLEVSWLANRFARGAPSGAGGWFPFRAIDLLPCLRDRLLFARGSAGRSQRTQHSE